MFSRLLLKDAVWETLSNDAHLLSLVNNPDRPAFQGFVHNMMAPPNAVFPYVVHRLRYDAQQGEAFAGFDGRLFVDAWDYSDNALRVSQINTAIRSLLDRAVVQYDGTDITVSKEPVAGINIYARLYWQRDDELPETTPGIYHLSNEFVIRQWLLDSEVTP